MRNNIVHIWADELTYEIRWIIAVAEQLQKAWKELVFENIWDPVAKWHTLPDWMKEIVKKESENDLSFWYCPTKWINETRDFLANLNNKKWEVQISSEDILFFNGLWDAISTFYHYLRKESRVIWPSPAYSTHSSAEAAHAGSHHITYSLDPNNNWQPDLDELYNKVKYNESISWILLINPDNPTWAVFPRKTLERVVEIAEEFDLFVLADEIYAHTVYWEEKYVSLAEIIWDRPWVAMKWISKEFPWPWSRCWWIEVYNWDKDKNFARFIKTLNDAKMLEVCSTTLPQRVIPKIMSDEKYEPYHEERNDFFRKRSDEAFEIFSNINGITINKTVWAFYFSVVFNDSILWKKWKMQVESKYLDIIREELKWASFDKTFVLYCLAKTWICTVPLSSFNSDFQWFRMTLLEKDDKKFTDTCLELKTAIEEYLGN